MSVPLNSSLSALQAERGSRPTRRHPREETAFAELKLVVSMTACCAVPWSVGSGRMSGPADERRRRRALLGGP